MCFTGPKRKHIHRIRIYISFSRPPFIMLAERGCIKMCWVESGRTSAHVSIMYVYVHFVRVAHSKDAAPEAESPNTNMEATCNNIKILYLC